MGSGQERQALTAGGLSEAKRVIAEIPLMELREADPVRRAAARRNVSSRVEGVLEEVLSETADPADAPIRAEAYAARGDLYWVLANLPELPGATTQPALRMPQTPDHYLKQAEEAYQTIIQRYGDRPVAVATAMFGLAAIAENRGQFDAAKAQYTAISNREDFGPLVRALAFQHLANLPRLSEPVFMGTVTSQPSTLPSTLPATPATQP
jgi:hypothetical protein